MLHSCTTSKFPRKVMWFTSNSLALAGDPQKIDVLILKMSPKQASNPNLDFSCHQFLLRHTYQVIDKQLIILGLPNSSFKGNTEIPGYGGNISLSNGHNPTLKPPLKTTPPLVSARGFWRRKKRRLKNVAQKGVHCWDHRFLHRIFIEKFQSSQ